MGHAAGSVIPKPHRPQGAVPEGVTTSPRHHLDRHGNTKAKVKEKVVERNVTGERPKIGIFVCRCGVNIAGVVDVPAVVEYAAKLPYVEYVGDNLFSCSQDNQDKLRQVIREHRLNRVIVVSCTPRTHAPLFQKTIQGAGLNAYLFDMANLREQCSWVHMKDKPGATEKAKVLVRMAVAKARLLEPLHRQRIGIIRSALVIGGGISGMTAALALPVERDVSACRGGRLKTEDFSSILMRLGR